MSAGCRAGRAMVAATAALLALALAPVAHGATPAPPAGLPSGAPAAATEPEPTLPAPSGWPFPESFPRTSGTGREDGGASYWSDFLYDDHGALGVPMGTVSNPAELAPVRGTYTYPSGPADRNGADIFRAAVGVDSTSTYWRVDWNTLADPNVPIAEWTFDTDGSAATGSALWPANANLRSAGIERALVVSAHGAWLVDPLTGLRTDVRAAGGALTVDTTARSFVVRIPRSVLPVSGTWKVRLAAGLANAAGTDFAPVSLAQGALPGQPNAYNVTFRTYQQEGELVCPPGIPLPAAGHLPVAECGNFWMENDQAQTLALGDVSKYSLAVDWSALAARTTTPEPLPTGYSNRWYVSRLSLGQGVVADSGGLPTGDLRPNFLGRVQPYAVYVPIGYDPSKPTPLTWVLHSLGANHNQYGGVAPSQLQEECQDRGSICATTLGFGPDGWYFDEAEADFWQVWRTLADHYDLDPDATVMSGYSMGGYASYKLALAYPDLFAKAMALEGPPACGARIAQGVGEPASSSNAHCAQDGDTTPLLGNARWLPYVMTYGVIDELVPFTSGLQQVDAIDKLGYRYYAVLYPLEDHLVFAVQNDFSPATSQLGSPRRVIDPPRIDYSWYPDLSRTDFGIGPTGVYWVRGLAARDHAAGRLAKLEADSAGIPDAPVTAQRSTSALAQFHPTPAAVRQLTWKLGSPPATQSSLSLTLADVASLGVDTVRARFTCGPLEVSSDGPATVRLLRLAPASYVTIGGRVVARPDGSGTATVSLPAGKTTATVSCSVHSGATTGAGSGGGTHRGKRHTRTGTSTGGGSGPSAAAHVSSASSGSSLPFTGADLAATAGLGAALLLAGLLLRRRRSTG